MRYDNKENKYLNKNSFIILGCYIHGLNSNEKKPGPAIFDDFSVTERKTVTQYMSQKFGMKCCAFSNKKLPRNKVFENVQLNVNNNFLTTSNDFFEQKINEKFNGLFSKRKSSKQDTTDDTLTRHFKMLSKSKNQGHVFIKCLDSEIIIIIILFKFLVQNIKKRTRQRRLIMCVIQKVCLVLLWGNSKIG